MLKTEHQDKALSFYKPDDWLAKYVGEEWFSAFHHPQFLNIHAFVYSVKPVYFTYSNKGKLVFAVSSFEENGKLVVPDHFLRTGFWVSSAFNEIQVITFLQEMLKELKTIYHSIKFNLPVDINDVRPFVWSGFKFKLMHTYEKKLNTHKYHTNISRMLNKKDPGFIFTCLEKDFNSVLELHRRDFYRFGVRRRHVALYLPLLQKLREEGFLIDLNLKVNNEIVASNLVLLNKAQNKAYVVLIARSEKWYKFGAHAKIYHRSFEYLKNEGYEVADLFGADEPGFALFKLKFAVELKHYYQVYYNSTSHLSNKIITEIKHFLKKVIP